jgi:ATP-dependent RNA helicase SUPV3L1/SUV3
MLEAEITNAGDVLVEGQHVGLLQGFRFTPDPQAAGEAARTLNAAAQKALATEMDQRATRVSEAVDEAFVLARDGTIRWLGEPIAKLAAGDHILAPKAHILADEQLTGSPLEAVQRRLDLWLTQHVKKHLGPLADLEAGEGLEGIARGIAFQIGEHLGVLDRALVAEDVRGLSQDARGALRKFGVRFGAYHLFLPQLLKPAPRALAAQLWALKNGGLDVKGLDEVPHLAASGRTSFVADPEIPAELYRAAGFRVCGERAVRVDILERLADLIRPAIAYRPGVTSGNPPLGAADKDAFVITGAMTSLAGCSGEAFASILRSLGYVAESRPGPAITVPLVPAAPTQPVAVAASETESSTERANADAGAASAQQTETLIASDDSFLPLGIGEEPATDESHEQSDEALALASEMVEEPAPSVSETVEPVPESAAPAESETLVALGDAPVAPEEAHASAEAVLSEASEAAVASETTENSTTSESAEQSSGETTGEHAEAAAEETEETPAEPVMIEVWRIGRQQFQRRPERQQHKRQPRVFNITPRPPKDGANGPQRFRRDRTEEQKPEGEAVTAEAQATERPVRAPDQRPRFKGKDDRRRNDRYDDRRGARPSTFSTETRSRDRAPDPDSPFAKLAALKAELEKNKKG